MSSKPTGEQFVVISKTLIGEDYRDCRIILEGEPFPAVYRQVYGPASKEECEKWVAGNCDQER